MIRVTELSYVFPPVFPGASPVIAINQLSLHIPEGQCLAITGANNSGKTTLCLAIGLGKSFSAGKLTGSIQIAGQIGMVFQDPIGQLFNATIADEIAWGLENIGLSPAEIEQRVVDILQQVGLGHLPHDRAPHSLSGGEQKKLALGTALALNPSVLILDEPMNGLSPASRSEMIQLLQDLKKNQGMTILLAENDAEVIAALADEVMQLGRNVGWIKERSDVSTISNNLSTNKFAIECDNVSFSYGEQKLLSDLNLKIPKGQFIALIGENGAGKTTFSRHLIGLARPQQGQIRIMGQDIAQQSTGQLAKTVGVAFQNPELQIFCPTVHEEIAFGPKNLGMTNDVVQATLELFDLMDIADHPPAVLSFSQRRRVALASIAAMQTPVLVLDEPTVGLDAYETNRLMNWLVQCHQKGATIILITHDITLAEKYVERILVLQEGKVHELAL